MTKLQVVAMLCVLCACGTKTPSPQQQQTLERQAQSTLAEMTGRDPGLSAVLHDSIAYAVFPSVGAAGAIVGGAFGKGILYEHGAAAGYVELKQASIGLELGGQSFAELIVFRNPQEVEDLKAGNFKMGTNVSAVAITAGAAAATRISDQAAVFVMPRGGLMASVSVTGQTIGFRPLSAMR